MQAQKVENPGRPLTTVKEAAAHLGLSVAKLYLLMGKGELPFVKLGKSRRIEWRDLESLVARSKVNGAAQASSN